MNKMKVGDVVKMKPSYLAKYVLWMFSAYQKPKSDEVEKEDLPELHFFLDSHIKKTPIIGKVIGFGCEEDNNSGRRNIRVEISAKNVHCTKYYFESKFTKVKSENA